MLILPMLVGALVFNMAYRQLEQSELNLQKAQLNSCIRETDRFMRQVDDFILLISQDTNLTSLLNLHEQPGYISKEASAVYSAYSSLSRADTYFGLNAQTVIYMNEPDMVFDGSSIVYGQERFYNIALSYQGVSYEEFKSNILDNYQDKSTFGRVIIEKKNMANRDSAIIRSNGFLYARTLPLTSGRHNPLGTAIVHVDSQIDELINLIPVSEDGSTYIMDKNQNIIAGIFSDGMDESLSNLSLEGDSGTFYYSLGGQRHLVSYASSGYNGWYYITMSPIRQLMSGLYTFQVTAIIVLTAALAVSVMFSFLFSRRSARPLEDVLREVKAAYAKEDTPPSGLGKRIRKILDENASLQSELESQKIMGRGNFINGLFRGEYASERDILTLADYFGIDLRAACYCAMIFEYAESNPSEGVDEYLQKVLAVIHIKNVSAGTVALRAVSNPVGDRRYGVILCFDSDDSAQNTKAIMEFTGQLIKENTGPVPHIKYYVGNFAAELSDICISYGEADSACQQNKDSGDGGEVLFYRDALGRKNRYFYPNEIQMKLKHLVEIGDIERLKDMLAYIYRENKIHPTDKHLAYVLVMDMYATLMTVTGSLKTESLLMRLYKLRLSSFHFEQEYERLTECFLRMAGQTAVREPEIDWGERMEQFVRDNLGNSEMNVAMMSRQFHRSETYFSQYFKRVIGQTFSKYLENLRISKACALLKETSKSVGEIAEEVGYANALTFRRAFKKATGSTPSEFKAKELATHPSA
jgi:AraC-like DNA-binding protein